MADKKTRQLLRTNKHGPVLQLWLNKNSQNGATAMALDKNKTVHTVNVFVEEDFMEAPHEQLMVLFDEIGRLPLRNLYIYSFGRNYDLFPIKLFIHVFDYADNLEVLTLYFIELGGCERYFQTFEELLRGHQHLKEFRLENCRIAENILESLAFDKFITTVSTLPKMEKIDLCATEMGSLGMFTAAGLTKIASLSKTLKSLTLMNFVFTNEHILALSDAASVNTKLTHLSISCDPNYCNNVALMLATNKTLTHLHLRLVDLYDDVFLSQIAIGLEENKTLRKFELTGENNAKMSRKAQKFFVLMMEKNETLEQLEINFTDESLRKKAQFYLKLNQTGKRHLMIDPDTKLEVLIDALAFVGNDLDCLHHFLVNTPAMVQK